MPFSLENKLNWLYLDINSYFATVEQQVNPELRYKPIAVVPLLSDSTSAIAASQEAKLKGIKTGTRIYEAKKLCPELICIQARHELYVEYHNKIFQEVDRHLQVDHIFSIDEGACRLTGKYCSQEEAISIAKIIKEAIKTNVGDYITCSIGVASNRYLAKIASNMQKPDGLVVIAPEDLPQKLYDLSLRDLPGIGSRTYEKILGKGISTIEELCRFDAKRLKAVWGSVWGEKVWYLMRGADLPLEATQKSTIGHSQVLAPELRGVGQARNILITLVLKAAHRLRSKSLYANSIVLSVELMSRQTIKSSIKIEASCDNNSFTKPVLKSWDNLVKLNELKEVRKVSISLHGLQTETKQLCFSDLQAERKQQVLSRAIDSLNEKLGSNSVTIGVSPNQHKTKAIVAFGHIPNQPKKIKQVGKTSDDK